MKAINLILVSIVALATIAVSGQHAQAQGAAPSPASQSTIPEKDPSATGNLSDKLSVTNGVVQPPAGIDPKIQTQAPVPDPKSTLVIPPPGTLGNQPNVQPK